MVNDGKDPKNADKSSPQVSRPVRYTTQDQERINLNMRGAPQFDPALEHRGIALDMLLDEMKKVYPNDSRLNENILRQELNRLLGRFHDHGVVHLSSLLCSVQLLDLLSQSEGCPALTQAHHPFVLCVAAMMVGAKFIEDIPFDNKTWGSGSGMPTSLLNNAEEDILKSLHFQPFNAQLFEVKKAKYEEKVSEIAGPSPSGRPGSQA
jgi:hypothetical protein